MVFIRFHSFGIPVFGSGEKGKLESDKKAALGWEEKATAQSDEKGHCAFFMPLYTGRCLFKPVKGGI